MEKTNLSEIVLGTDTGSGISSELELSAIVDNTEELVLSAVPETTTEVPKRTIADFSTLPKEEVLGVDIKVSPEHELFKAGGDFENYMKEKESEMEKVIADIDAHNEMIAASIGEEVPEVITDADIKRAEEKISKVEDLDEGLTDEFISESLEDKEYVDPLELESEPDVIEEVKVKLPTSTNSSIAEVEKERTATVYGKISKTVLSKDLGVNASFDIDPEDQLDDEKVEKVDEEENLEALRRAISEKIAPVSKRFDISTFSIQNKPVTAKSIMDSKEYTVADWALLSAKAHIAMREFSGKELSVLGDDGGLNRFSVMKNRYKLFYDHLSGDNKPESFESWLKSMSFLDNDHLYGAVFIANFAGANYIPYDCGKCKKTFLSENIPTENMYRFKTNEDAANFNAIRDGKVNEMHDLYVSEVIPVNEKVAIAFREPSIYSIIFETSLLDEQFADKYKEVISVISYIDNIMIIDAENKTISPLYYKRYPENKVKDIKSRIIEFAKILSTLSPDEYSIVLAYLNSINSLNDSIVYQLPEVTCPHCGNVIKAQDTSAESLVFMRHQLAALATTSIK